MSAPKIPKGWRKLRVGEIRRCGDKFHDTPGVFSPCYMMGPVPKHRGPTTRDFIIRRAQPRRHAGKGKKK